MTSNVDEFEKYKKALDVQIKALELFAESTQTDISSIKEELLTIKENLANLGSAEDMKDLITEANNKLSQEINANISTLAGVLANRLTSIAFVPKTNINGIPAILFTTAKYNAFSVKYEEDKDSKSGYKEIITKAQNDKKEDIITYLSNDSTMAYYRLNPIGITTEDFSFPSFDCITAENISRSVDEKLAKKNSPIMPVPGQQFTIKDGVLAVRVRKSIDTGAITGTGSEQEGTTESFYMASLNMPIAEKNLTSQEKADKAAPSVNSEYVRLEETVGDVKTMFVKTTREYPATEIKSGGHYDNYVNTFALTQGKGICHDIPYNKAYDLRKTSGVCFADGHNNNFNYKNYGLALRFQLAPGKLEYGANKTDQQKYAKVSADSLTLTSYVYDEGIIENEAAVDKEPIIAVYLMDTVRNVVVDLDYMKVKFVREIFPPRDLGDWTFAQDTVSCQALSARYTTPEMNKEIYAKAKDGGMSKNEFHKNYTALKINKLVKTSGDYSMTIIENGEFTEAATEWAADLNISALTSYAGLLSANQQRNEDIRLVYNNEDPNVQESFNLEWYMSDKAVGTIDPTTRKATFTLEAIMNDPDGVYGDLTKTFTWDIVIPAQRFYYQGTFWQTAGEIYRINPIVYNTGTHGIWANAAALGTWNTVSTNNDYAWHASHLSSDMVNGYLNGDDETEPEKISDFITLKHRTNEERPECATAEILFDTENFKNYEHLKSYSADDAETELYTVGEDGETKLVEAARIVNDIDVGAATSYISLYEANGENNYKLDDASGQSDKNVIIPAFNANTPKGFWGTSAAIDLIDKNVPVKLKVAYNDYNILIEDRFATKVITPLTIDGTVKDPLVDAAVNGSFTNVATGFTMTDWNKYTVAKETAPNATAKKAYAKELYQYYGVTKVVWDVKNVKTSLKLVDNVYKHDKSTTTGKLPSQASLKAYTDANHTTEGNVNAQVLGYFNDNGSMVETAYYLYVPVEVTYKWGVAKATVKIAVNPSEGAKN